MEDAEALLPLLPTSQVFHLGREIANLFFPFEQFQHSLEEMNAAAVTGSEKCPIRYLHNLSPVKILEDHPHDILLITGHTVTSKLQINRLLLPL